MRGLEPVVKGLGDPVIGVCWEKRGKLRGSGKGTLGEGTSCMHFQANTQSLVTWNIF